MYKENFAALCRVQCASLLYTMPAAHKRLGVDEIY